MRSIVSISIRRQHRRSRVWAGATATLAVVLLAGAACDRNSPAPPAQESAAGNGGATLTTLRTFDVDENDAVVNVTPRLRVDPRGGFLVFDSRESQIRRYSSAGKLLWFAGRRGDGPGEFRDVAGAARMPSGEIVAVDRKGRLTFFDGDGRQVLRTTETEVGRVADLEVVDDSTLLISGVRKGEDHGPRLHVWNVAARTITTAFFAPSAHQRNQVAAGAMGFVMAALRGDTIAATFGSSDTIYFFTRDGRAAGRVALNSRHFRRTPDAGPDKATLTADRRTQAEWLSSFDIVADVDWLPDGGLLIAYQSIEPRAAMDRRWHLLGQDRAGIRRFEVQDVSSLVVGTDPGSGMVIFVPPDADAPNRWAVARLPRTHPFRRVADACIAQECPPNHRRRQHASCSRG
jgi:hypothetical protein